MNKNKNQFKSSKANNQDFLRSNVETGAHNWNWQLYQNNYRMNDEEINAYKKQQLANAKKVGGGILNTNVETGNWHGMQFMVPEKSDRIGPNDIEAQEKFFRGQLKETITGPLPGERGQNAPVKFNNNGKWGQEQYDNKNYINKNNDNRYQFVEKNNNNYNEGYNNNMKNNQNYHKNYENNYQNDQNVNEQKKNFQERDNFNKNFHGKNNNFEEPDVEKLMEAGPGVLKVEATEKIITENGVKKKLTRIKKYMENGETKEEIYKTNA